MQHDKHAWSKAASVAARAAALDSEKLTRRAEKAEKEAEDLRAQVAALKSALEAEKLRSSKQQALSSAAVQAANKRASQFEQLYEHAKATAMEERHKVESFRVAATELNRQLEYGGPGGAIPLNLLLSSSATDAGIRAARRSMGAAAGAAGTTPVPATTAAGATPGSGAGKRGSVSRGGGAVSAGTPSPRARPHGAGSPSVSATSKVTANLASKAAAGVKSTATSGGGKAGQVTAPLSALLHKAASPRTSAVGAGQEAASPPAAPEVAAA